MRLLPLMLMLVSFASVAQINVHLTSGKVISTKYAYLYSADAFSDSYVRINDKKGEKILINRVDHIEGTDQKGGTHYIKPVDIKGNEVWGDRGYTSDRIEIYYTDIVIGTLAASHKYKHCVYSKDGGPWQLLKLKNLKRDLADSPEAMQVLRKGKAIAITQVGLYITGYSLVVGGIVNFIDEQSSKELGDPEKDAAVSIPPLVLAGAIVSWTPFLINGLKRAKYVDALEAYK
jgi:hypothetical protein